MKRRTKIAAVSTLAVLTGCVATYKYATKLMPAKTTVVNYWEPLSPSRDPEGKLGKRGMSAVLIQIDPRHNQDPDGPYEVAIIAEPLPWDLTQEQKESRIRDGQTRTRAIYINGPFFDDIGRSLERLRSMVPFPINSFEIMTERQEGVDGFNFEQVFSEHLMTYDTLFGITKPYENPQSEREDQNP